MESMHTTANFPIKQAKPYINQLCPYDEVFNIVFITFHVSLFIHAQRFFTTCSMSYYCVKTIDKAKEVKMQYNTTSKI